MKRDDIASITIDDPMGLIYKVFKLSTKEEGTVLVYILDERPLLSNNWLYVTKDDYDNYKKNNDHKYVRVVNGKDIISLSVAIDSMLSRRKKF
jgi:hypothetical protein